MPLRVLLQAVGREIHEGVEMLHIELILVELHCLVPGLTILSRLGYGGPQSVKIVRSKGARAEVSVIGGSETIEKHKVDLWRGDRSQIVH